MSWRPNSGIAESKARARMQDRARKYFEDQGLLEVTTPALLRTASTDPNLASLPVNQGKRRSWLRTSPEHAMKRLLAAGYPDIFQICNVFRDDEAGRHHLAEFTMIEWYRLGYELQDIMCDTIALITSLFANIELANTRFVSYSEAFNEAMSIDALATDSGAFASELEADSDLRRALGDDRDAWLDLAMATRVAPSFANDRLTVVHHYPASQAALSRLCPADDRLADRFEIFYGSLELANGFVELTEADEQLRRFENDMAKRVAAGMPAHDIDADLIAALRSGLPACAGVALGLDRVLMIDEGHDNIHQITTFTPGSEDEC